jgi:hypothetical protein
VQGEKSENQVENEKDMDGEKPADRGAADRFAYHHKMLPE